MNKLLLLGLFSACLVVITNGLEQAEEKSASELDAISAAIRTAREADPKKNTEENKNKSKKGRKGKKGKKNNNNKKVSTKNKNNKKGKRKAQKGNKKDKKGKGGAPSGRKAKKRGSKKGQKSKKDSRKIKKGNKKGAKKVARKGNQKGNQNKKGNRKIKKQNKKNNKKSKKGNNKSRKANKNGNKKKRKGRKGSKKASKKGSKKAKKEKKKGSKKDRKAKKKGSKKDRKAKKDKKENKKGTRKIAKATSSCMNATCIDNAMKYMQTMKLKVSNFLVQKKRIEKYNTTAGNKAGKKGLFGPILNRIREAGGGNSSNLKCNGDNSTAGAGTNAAGAKQFMNLTVSLKKCENNINTSCSSDLPALNATHMALCEVAMNAFKNLTDTCIKLTGTAACTCWESDGFTFTAKAVKKCDLKSTNTKMTAAKKSCTSAFGKCRKLEDDVSSALSACSPLNSKSRAIASIKQGLKNIAAAAKVQTKLNTTAGATKRATASMTCAAFLTLANSAKLSMLTAPLLVGTETLMTTVIDAVVAACSDAEKKTLITTSGEFGLTANNIKLTIEAKNTDLLTSTGSTVSTTAVQATIDSEASATTVTTASAAAQATTKKASGRRHRQMFKASNMKIW